MTTITIERATLDRLIDAWDSTVLPKSRDGMMQERMEDLRAALAAPATAPEPVATLHDDGYWTWKQVRPPHQSNYAGWRMDVYAHPAHTEQEVQEIFQACYNPSISLVETVRRILGVPAQ